jgi:hypothetical protein
MNNKHAIRFVLLGLLCFLVASLLPALPVHAESGEPTFSLTSASGQPATGGNWTVDIHADGVSDMVAFELMLAVDPQKWSFVEAGSSLSGYKATPLQELRGNGVITFTYMKIGQAAGENGSVNLGRVTLKAKEPGNGRVVLSGARLVDSDFGSVNYSPNVAIDVTITGGGSGNDNSNGNSNGDSGAGDGNPSNLSQQQVVNEESLKPDGSGKAVVSIAEGKKEVLLPVNAAGAVYHIGLSIVTKDGRESKSSSFGQPVELSFPYDEGADESVLGIYYLNESTKAWEYVGGVADKAGKRINVRLNHFSIYGVFEYHKSFADVPANHWASAAIRALAAKHVANGESDTAYAPANKVTRAEFAALLTRALGMKPTAAAPFADVSGASWYADEVAAAYEAKLINGKSQRLFAPNTFITREEMAAMLVRAFEFGTGAKASPGAASFADEAAVSKWVTGDVRTALSSGLMSGTGGGKFAPSATTTRAEAAKAVFNLLTKLDMSGV